MRTTSGLAAAAFTSAMVLTGAPSALAVCDPYSTTCVDDTVQERPEQVVRPRSNVEPQTLPFTGGEAVLMGVVGISAVAGGIALVAAGRKRSSAA